MTSADVPSPSGVSIKRAKAGPIHPSFLESGSASSASSGSSSEASSYASHLAKLRESVIAKSRAEIEQAAENEFQAEMARVREEARQLALRRGGVAPAPAPAAAAPVSTASAPKPAASAAPTQPQKASPLGRASPFSKKIEKIAAEAAAAAAASASKPVSTAPRAVPTGRNFRFQAFPPSSSFIATSTRVISGAQAETEAGAEAEAEAEAKTETKAKAKVSSKASSKSSRSTSSSSPSAQEHDDFARALAEAEEALAAARAPSRAAGAGSSSLLEASAEVDADDELALASSDDFFRAWIEHDASGSTDDALAAAEEAFAGSLIETAASAAPASPTPAARASASAARTGAAAGGYGYGYSLNSRPAGAPLAPVLNRVSPLPSRQHLRLTGAGYAAAAAKARAPQHLGHSLLQQEQQQEQRTLGSRRASLLAVTAAAAASSAQGAVGAVVGQDKIPNHSSSSSTSNALSAQAEAQAKASAEADAEAEPSSFLEYSTSSRYAHAYSHRNPESAEAPSASGVMSPDPVAPPPDWPYAAPVLPQSNSYVVAPEVTRRWGTFEGSRGYDLKLRPGSLAARATGPLGGGMPREELYEAATGTVADSDFLVGPGAAARVQGGSPFVAFTDAAASAAGALGANQLNVPSGEVQTAAVFPAVPPPPLAPNEMPAPASFIMAQGTPAQYTVGPQTSVSVGSAASLLGLTGPPRDPRGGYYPSGPTAPFGAAAGARGTLSGAVAPPMGMPAAQGLLGPGTGMGMGSGGMGLGGMGGVGNGWGSMGPIGPATIGAPSPAGGGTAGAFAWNNIGDPVRPPLALLLSAQGSSAAAAAAWSGVRADATLREVQYPGDTPFLPADAVGPNGEDALPPAAIEQPVPMNPTSAGPMAALGLPMGGYLT